MLSTSHALACLFLTTSRVWVLSPYFRYKDEGSEMWRDAASIAWLIRDGWNREANPGSLDPEATLLTLTVRALTRTQDARRDSISKGKACSLTNVVPESLQQRCLHQRDVGCVRWHAGEPTHSSHVCSMFAVRPGEGWRLSPIPCKSLCSQAADSSVSRVQRENKTLRVSKDV